MVSQDNTVHLHVPRIQGDPPVKHLARTRHGEDDHLLGQGAVGRQQGRGQIKETLAISQQPPRLVNGQGIADHEVDRQPGQFLAPQPLPVLRQAAQGDGLGEFRKRHAKGADPKKSFPETTAGHDQHLVVEQDIDADLRQAGRRTGEDLACPPVGRFPAQPFRQSARRNAGKGRRRVTRQPGTQE